MSANADIQPTVGRLSPRAAIQEVRRAIIAALRRTAEKAWNTQDPPVSKGGGALEDGFEKADTTVVLQASVGEKVIEVTLQDVVNAILRRGTEYTKYHVVESGDFNIHYNPNFYNNPSTSGTRPIKASQIITEMRKRFPIEFEKELNRRGIPYSK